ncbi:amino acid ABC transporter substrate-binding protein [Photobacterium atrarenae]|uniref:Amino acid ABC transporter substrate-binding protein n=1 Tax=Photobacterium atrarenae TaxID=865757 RepID=A0ABY5GJ78_9GAMM|nr:amino acid ABC transporter substrate-binding protein [Photobacterium atrarenae]UTV29359.1 amino acid ABC transporter substrate-binding protein [Photobacterium atrarenae]
MAATDVKVGMSGRYFPFTFVKQDQLQGFEVDLWNEIGKRNDYNVEFVTANFSGLFGLLETGRIDTISNQITITKERQAKYLFADPYVIDGAQLVVRKGNDSIKSTADLDGKTVGVNLGSNYEQLLRELDKDGKINIKTYETGIEHDVALGRTDAFVMDRLSSVELIKKANLPLQLAGEPFERIENAWPFMNNEKGEALRDDVNQALKSMREDGTLAEISQKWFDADITR